MISAIILAAGEGKRIGSTKALLNWGNENLINYQINSLSHERITEKIVVVGSESEKVKKSISKNEIKIAENNNYLSGKTSSIKKGIDAATLYNLQERKVSAFEQFLKGL